jgi:3-oxoacyl-[acyl-carrier protein] reductase
MFTPLSNRSIFITGASKGIGLGIAKVFARSGAKVFLAARSLSGLEQALAAIKAAGGTAQGCACDVARKEEVTAAAARAAAAFGGIDVLCANAGIFPAADLETMAEAAFSQVLDTNLKGTFLSVQACIPYLKKSPAGRIIITSSITGPITGYPGWSHYGASKAGQMGFIRTAAIELAKYGITVNAVMPGNILTEGLQEAGDEYLAAMTNSIPLRRLGKPEDIGYTALFLASQEAGYITGQGIVVDGGQILPEGPEALG